MFHLQRIQRDFDPMVATLFNLQQIYQLKDVDKEDVKPTMPEKLTKTDKVKEVNENIESLLLTIKGLNGVPLLYVVRNLAALPIGIGDNVDLGFGLLVYTLEMI
jgi:hypothetical protein